MSINYTLDSLYSPNHSLIEWSTQFACIRNFQFAQYYAFVMHWCCSHGGFFKDVSKATEGLDKHSWSQIHFYILLQMLCIGVKFVNSHTQRYHVPFLQCTSVWLVKPHVERIHVAISKGCSIIWKIWRRSSTIWELLKGCRSIEFRARTVDPY